MGFVVLTAARMRCQGISKPSVQGRRLVQFPQHVEPVQSRATLNNRPQGSSVTCGLLPVSTPEAHKSPLAITPAGFFVPVSLITMKPDIITETRRLRMFFKPTLSEVLSFTFVVALWLVIIWLAYLSI